METRKTFVDAKIQHLPLDLWFVTGLPSNGIFKLNVCVSLRTAEGFSSTFAGFCVERAERARRFFGSCKVVEIHEFVFETETVVDRSCGSVEVYQHAAEHMHGSDVPSYV